MLHVIIPVYNRWAYTKRCLESLREQTFSEFTVVVVDDGSTDETARDLEALFPEVIRLQGDGNLFWTAAINMGIRYAVEKGADYVMTLNNDTIAQTQFLEQMMAGSRSKRNTVIRDIAEDDELGKACYEGEIMDWRAASEIHLLNLLPQ